MTDARGATREERETAFWDANACRVTAGPLLLVGPADRHDRIMPWLPYLGVPRLIETLLAIVGDLRGRRLLDFGTGSGFLAVLLALKGASVEAVDVSAAQLAAARGRASLNGVADRISFRTTAGDTLDYPAASFDAVVGSFVLHHANLPAVAPEFARVLKPGGTGVFLETSGRNRLLVGCRRLLAGRFGVEKHSSPDERPLDRRDEAVLREAFDGNLRYHDPILLFARALPSQVPLFRLRPLMWACKAVDDALGLFSPLRRLSYFTVVELRKGRR